MVKLIVYIVVGLIVLSFFGISLQNLIDSPTTQENFRYFGTLVELGWEQFLEIARTFLNPILSVIGLDF